MLKLVLAFLSLFILCSCTEVKENKKSDTVNTFRGDIEHIEAQQYTNTGMPTKILCNKEGTTCSVTIKPVVTDVQ
jgi:outer membrane biogenesis lipoprotein LolB